MEEFKDDGGERRQTDRVLALELRQALVLTEDACRVFDHFQFFDLRQESWNADLICIV